jgi:hypothetical protein
VAKRTAPLPGSSKRASTLLVLFIPSVDRYDEPIEQDGWVEEALKVLGESLGGATAFPQGRGVWRDDERGGRLVFDAPVIVQSYTTEKELKRGISAIRAFLIHMGRETRQGAVGLVIDRDYLEITFPEGTE